MMLGLAIVLALATVGMAADFPTKPVNLIVAYAAGGSGDVVVRAMLDKFSEKLGAPAVLVNKPGSGGLIGGNMWRGQSPTGTPCLF